MDLQQLLRWMAGRGAQLSVERRPPDQLVFHLAACPKPPPPCLLPRNNRWQRLTTAQITISERAADLDVGRGLFASTLEKLIASIEELEVKIADGDKAEAPGRGQQYGAAEVAADYGPPDPDHQV